MDRRIPIDYPTGEEIKFFLADELPHYAVCHLDAGLDGDERAAFSLCCATPNGYRGHVALAAYFMGTPNPAYREIIRSVWNHDGKQMAAVAKQYKVSLRNMMAAGRFPHEFKGAVDIFRGASGKTPRQAAMGLSWSASRDVACYFAYRHATGEALPIVVKTTIDASSIVFWDDSRDEQEIVTRHCVATAVDPEPGTWLERCERLLAARNAEQSRRLNEAKLKLAQDQSSNRTT